MMKYYTLSLFTFWMMLMSVSTSASELIGSNISINLNRIYQLRNTAPQECITLSTKIINSQSDLQDNAVTIIDNLVKNNSHSNASVLLLALCNAQLENYQQAMLLLEPLLNKNKTDNIRILNLIAFTIPKQERPLISNQTLIFELKKWQEGEANSSSDLWILIQLSISKLALEEHQYQLASQTLDNIQKKLQAYPSENYQAWLTYYYALYYTQINQQQLADTYLRSANEQAVQLNILKLRIQVNTSLAKMYQSKYRFSQAIVYAKKSVDLYLKTKNIIKQAHGLILLASLERQKKDNNQSLLYLLNALELIQHDSNRFLLATIYLEIGKTYVAQIDSIDDDKELQLARKYLQNARYHFSTIQRPHYLMEVLILLAQINIINDDPGLAILQLNKALNINTKKEMTLRVKAYKMLALGYELTSEYQKSIIYFKKFNVLENIIKQRLLVVQQLQVNEQLHLFEQTQNQKQLQAENRKLQTSTQQLKKLSYATILIVVVVFLYLIFTLLHKKKLQQALLIYQRKMTFHPRTNLLLQKTGDLDFNSIYKDKKLYYALVNIPFLTNLHESIGINAGMKIEMLLGKALKLHFKNDDSIYQIKDHQILIISTVEQHLNSSTFIFKIIDFFKIFSLKHHLTSSICIGLVTFPFLNNTNIAISPTQTLNINHLALYSAKKTKKTKNQSSWVELYAIDNLQPAFFDGDLWTLSQIAIQKGLIKIHSSHPNEIMSWPDFKNKHPKQ